MQAYVCIRCTIERRIRFFQIMSYSSLGVEFKSVDQPLLKCHIPTNTPFYVYQMEYLLICSIYRQLYQRDFGSSCAFNQLSSSNDDTNRRLHCQWPKHLSTKQRFGRALYNERRIQIKSITLYSHKRFLLLSYANLILSWFAPHHVTVEVSEFSNVLNEL